MSLRAVRRSTTRLLTAVLLTSAVSTTVATVAPTAALASTASMESQFVADMNAARQAAGLRPYAVAYDLTSIARQHSAQMASRQSLYHNPNLTSQVQDWQAVGENVGEGPTVSDIHNAFMHSPEHRANILDHDFTQVGVGVTVDGNGIVWVTEDFRQPMHSSSAPTQPATHTSTVSHTTARHTAQPTSAPAPRAVARTPHPAAPHNSTVRRARPVTTASPQARLLARLTAIRTAAGTSASPDPVAQTFDYLNTVTSLTTG